MLISLCLPIGLACAGSTSTAPNSANGTASFPAVEKLPSQSNLPDPLLMLDGSRVTTEKQWFEQRRPELKSLFQHYMYGYLPPAPRNIRATEHRVEPSYLGGKATKREVTIAFGPKGAPEISLLLVIPNKQQQPVPVFVGLNFCGNHSLLDDPNIALPIPWLYSFCPGGKNNRATEAGRGRMDSWSVEQSIDRGYAVATFYNGDIDPDQPDFSDGVHPHYLKKGQTSLGPHDWGTIAAWAWGIHRAVDYLVQLDEIDHQRIAVFGHSRNGKAALFAAAMDERIALSIPHQAGCGGTSPSRGSVGESVEEINTAFPHWFNDTFPTFNKHVDRLPFDQHSLVALVAPRPVLLSNAEQDTWSDPAGQFEMLEAADAVYRLLGVEGLSAEKMPGNNELIDSRLGFYIRPGEHSTTKEDWQTFLDFADRNMK